ncbi:hypothetical protein CPB84DRAFT_1850624 [Gymnopilus junonius]|uniref:Uncharacterized protein n=1 Tax=Gymnopilus junonius TaxID=109634 RepID=A0A9P5TK42_GYMJU|nr:hypothetical protein CPB84DRAFT_1850624 [Gymnopilus junonius]
MASRARAYDVSMPIHDRRALSPVFVSLPWATQELVQSPRRVLDFVDVMPRHKHFLVALHAYESHLLSFASKRSNAELLQLLGIDVRYADADVSQPHVIAVHAAATSASSIFDYLKICSHICTFRLFEVLGLQEGVLTRTSLSVSMPALSLPKPYGESGILFGLDKLDDWPKAMLEFRCLVLAATKKDGSTELVPQGSPLLSLLCVRRQVRQMRGYSNIVDNFLSAAIHLYLMRMLEAPDGAVPDYPADLDSRRYNIFKDELNDAEYLAELNDGSFYLEDHHGESASSSRSAAGLRAALHLALLVSPLYLLLTFCISSKSFSRRLALETFAKHARCKHPLVETCESHVLQSAERLSRGDIHPDRVLLDLVDVLPWSEIEAASNTDQRHLFVCSHDSSHATLNDADISSRKATARFSRVELPTPRFWRTLSGLETLDSGTSSSAPELAAPGAPSISCPPERESVTNGTTTPVSMLPDPVKANSVSASASSHDNISSPTFDGGGQDPSTPIDVVPPVPPTDFTVSLAETLNAAFRLSEGVLPDSPGTVDLALLSSSQELVDVPMSPLSEPSAMDSDDDPVEATDNSKQVPVAPDLGAAGSDPAGKAASETTPIDKDKKRKHRKSPISSSTPPGAKNFLHLGNSAENPINVDSCPLLLEPALGQDYVKKEEISLGSHAPPPKIKSTQSYVAWDAYGHKETFSPEFHYPIYHTRMERFMTKLTSGFINDQPPFLSSPELSLFKLIPYSSFISMDAPTLQGLMSEKHVVVTDIPFNKGRKFDEDAMRTLIGSLSCQVSINAQNSIGFIVSDGAHALGCSRDQGSVHLSSYWTVDGLNTNDGPICGDKLWAVMEPLPEVDRCRRSIFFVDKEKFCLDDVPPAAEYKFEGIVLRSTDMLFMKPSTPHFVYGITAAVCHGGHYYMTSLMQDTLQGVIHAFVLNNFLTNTAHWPTRQIFRRILLFYHLGLVEGCVPSSDRAAVHLPDIKSIDGVLNLLSAGYKLVQQSVGLPGEVVKDFPYRFLVQILQSLQNYKLTASRRRLPGVPHCTYSKLKSQIENILSAPDNALAAAWACRESMPSDSLKLANKERYSIPGPLVASEVEVSLNW